MPVDYTLGNLVVNTQVKDANGSIQSLKGLTTALNYLNNAMKKVAKSNVDLDQTGKKFEGLTKAIQPFTSELRKSESACKAFTNAIKVLNKQKVSTSSIEKASASLKTAQAKLQQINGTANQTQNIFDSLTKSKIFNLGKIYAIYNYTKRFTSQLSNAVGYAVNFEETLNKFQVSMGDQYSKSLKFVGNITRAFNLSTESIMNYQSTFKNMLDSLGGLSSDVTYKLSETITRMAIDYGSLFNVPIQKSMEQFQQVLSGQIRTIRTVAGYDVSETSLYNIYKEIGGTKTMRQLDQNEKRLLRIIALQKQMQRTGAVGDFEKTLSNTANILKQIQETTKEILTLFGRLFLGSVGNLSEKVLGATIALRDFLNYLNKIKGYEYQDFTKNASGGLIGGVTESAEEATDAVTELKRSLLGFDKLNILSSTSSNTKTAVNDYSFLTSKIGEYEELIQKVSNGSQKVADNILNWLGYTRKENGEIEKTSGAINRLAGMLNILKVTFTSLISIITVKKGFGIFKFFKNLPENLKEILKEITGKTDIDIPNLKNIKKVKDIFTAFSGVVEKPAKEVGIFSALSKSKVFSAISKPGQMLGQFIKLLPKSLVIIGTIATLFATLFIKSEEFRNSIMNLIKSIANLASSITSVLTPVLTPVIKFLGEGLALVINIIAKVIDFISKSKALSTVLGLLLASIIAINIATSVSPLTWIILGITTVIALIAKLIEAIAKLFAEGKVKTFFKNLFSRENSNGGGRGTSTSSYTPLASGGVITRPTPALVGEYSGARNNPEIVSPENKMREVFVQASLPIAQAILNSNQKVIDAIDDLSDRPIELNGRKVSESIFKDLQNEATRRGKKFA